MMHNEEVNLSIEDCRQEMTRLKALIEVVGAMSPVSNFLTKYAAVRCCGTLEQGYKSIIADYYEQFSDQLVSFISTHVRESSKNPSLANICKILNAFDEDKCKLFKEKLQQLESGSMVKQSLDSINEPTLKSKACLKCLYFTKIISDLCRNLECFSYLYTINQTE